MPNDKREPLKNGITRVTSPTGKVMYEARWTFTDQTGKLRYRRKSQPTLKLAKAYKARMEAAVAEERYDGATRMTVADYAEVWYSRRERKWATSSTNNNRRLWRLHVEPAFGKLRLTAVTRHQCQAFVDRLAETHKPTSVRGIHSILNGILIGAMRTTPPGQMPRSSSSWS